MENPEYSVSSLRPEPEGFAARVAHRLFSMQGMVLWNGEDHAFLDEGTMARVNRAGWRSMFAVLRRFVERVPEAGYEDRAFSRKTGLYAGPVRCVQ
jgi:hypothetical protein